MEASEIQKKLVNNYVRTFPKDAAIIFNKVEAEEILEYLKDQSLDIREKVLMSLSPDVIGDVILDMDRESFVELFNAMDPYSGALMLSRVKEGKLQELLALLPSKKAKGIREMLDYPPNSAGFLMDTRIMTFFPDNKVEEVLTKLRAIGDRSLVNIYVADSDRKLLGKVSVQGIAISSPEKTLNELLVPCPSVQVMTPEEEVVNIFQDGKVIHLPVVDLDGRILGIIRNEAMIAASQKDATEDALAMFGAGREERALSSPWLAIKKRLPWLEINLATAFLAASIVGIFEDTIAQITVLAVFLPVVAGQSGNTGSQALAVTIRGLALREIQTRHWWKVAKKEVVVGFINGIAVALSTSLIVLFWTSSTGLAIVIGTSMVLSMVIAGFSGAVVPIVLQAVGQDPAQSSSIVLTTVTDVMGFLSFLGLATALGSMLGII